MAQYAENEASEYLLKMADEIKNARPLKNEASKLALHHREIFNQLDNAYTNKYNRDYIAKAFYLKRDFENARNGYENRKANLLTAINNYEEAKTKKSIAKSEVIKLRNKFAQLPKISTKESDDVYQEIYLDISAKHQLEEAKSEVANSITQIKDIESNIYKIGNPIKNNETNIEMAEHSSRHRPGLSHNGGITPLPAAHILHAERDNAEYANPLIQIDQLHAPRIQLLKPRLRIEMQSRGVSVVMAVISIADIRVHFSKWNKKAGHALYVSRHS